MAKTIWLVIPGAEEDEVEGREAPIEPGHTAADLLSAADLSPENWGLQLQRNGESVSLSGQDDVYEQVKDKEKVHAVPKDMVVG